MSTVEDDLSEAAAPAPASRRTRVALLLSLAYAAAVVLLVVDRTDVGDERGSGSDGGQSTVVFSVGGASDDDGHAARAELARAHGAGFHLSLGDLAPAAAAPDGWCRASEAFAAAGVPLQHLASPRELAAVTDPGAAGASCVPDVLEADGAPPVRFAADLGDSVRLIGIAPGATVDGTEQSFAPGTELHGWLTGAIRSARDEPGRWVVVAMSEPCIDATLCPEQRALIDTLLAERVDLVLAGGRTGYQRNRPIGTGAGCPPMALGDLRDVEEACLAAPASVARMEAGAGTLLLLVGTGGGPLEQGARASEADGIVAASSADGEISATGVLLVTAHDDLLVTELVGADDEVHDRFTIDRRPTS